MINQWPIQIKMVSDNEKFFKDADLLIAADCTAYFYKDFYDELIHNKVVLIGCSKLDEGDYSTKLTSIFKLNDIKSITVVKMESSCCIGIVDSVKNALHQSGKLIRWKTITISKDGKLIK